MRPVWVLAGCLALGGAGCRHALDVTPLPNAPVADGLAEDWQLLPRSWWADGAVGGSAARDEDGLGLLLELRHPSWERAFLQGLVEVRLGGADPRGRRRVLAVQQHGWPDRPGEALSQAREPLGRDVGTRGPGDDPRSREPEFRWILRGEDYHDERRLPLSEAGGPRAAWGRLPDGLGSFLEVRLPLEIVQSLVDQGHLDVELARAPMPGDVPAGGREEALPQGPGRRSGAGRGGGGPRGERPGGRGDGPGGDPGHAFPGDSHPAEPARAGAAASLSGLPLELRLRLDGRE